MYKYNQGAIDFLSSCQAKLEIHYAGTSINHLWNEKQPRDMYSFVITTQRGSMNGIFWDSLDNTKKRINEKGKATSPNEYSILACLEKYDVGTMDEFMQEFGYEIRNANDLVNFIATYNAVVKEYRDLCRIFTPEQMDKLREIY